MGQQAAKAQPFYPQVVFAPGADIAPPRVLLAPPKYVQGPGVLDATGRYLSMLNYSSVAVLASARGHAAEAARVMHSLATAGIEGQAVTFGGECSFAEIEAATGTLQDGDQHATGLHAIIAVGGGKCVDTGKCVAHRLGVDIVVIPTLASNDAPCSAVSVIYTPEGVVTSAEFFPQNPAFVIVDTQVVANASERYLAAGIGDAMATWYEARVCFSNPNGRNVAGGRPTLAAVAMGEVCAKTLFEYGEAAVLAVRENRVDDALEQVVEANTLLSGVGFESGGLAGAHGLAEGYTSLPSVEKHFLHGEMVGMGVLTQLVMEDNRSEAHRVAEFFARVGLPIHLGQLNLLANDASDLRKVAQGALGFAPIHNLPFTVTESLVHQAILAADELGKAVTEIIGDAAYRQLQTGQ